MENPTSDEKVMAAVAHASVLFAFFGPLGPTLIWAFQRNKSKYVRFHALQAMGYQALIFWAWFIGIFVIIFGGLLVVAILQGFLIAGDTSSTPMVFPFIFQPIIFLGMFGLWGIFFILGIIGAIFCMMNRNFNYPIIGSWLKTQLFHDQVAEEEIEECEDNWVSAVCHSTAILQLWGIIIPLIVWFSQKERSRKLRFQALQAAIYQLTAFAVYMLGMMIYMLLFFVMVFGMMTLGITNSSSPNGELSPIAGVIVLIFSAAIIIFWLFFMLAGPIYLILAIIASISNIRGKDFKYPILGNIISRRMFSEIIEGKPQL